MTERIIAIGDIHGCANALATLLKAIQPTEQDTLVFLGDFIDRGPDSRGVCPALRYYSICRTPKVGDDSRLLVVMFIGEQRWIEGATERSNLLKCPDRQVYPIPGGRFIRFRPFLRCGNLFTVLRKPFFCKGIRRTQVSDATNPPSPLMLQ